MTDAAPSSAISDLPDDLPPVKPPSVVFIFQLFIVPALIVVAVVAVWVVFGKLASGDQDWQSLVAELNSPNHHIRQRAMYGLAQVLDTDRRQGDRGQHLSQNSQIARQLADRLSEQLKSSSVAPETIKEQIFLTRVLGQSDVAEVALPPLLKALEASTDVDVRRAAITAIMLIAGRAWEANTPLTGGDLSQGVITFSQEGDKFLRRFAAFALGLIKTPEALDRLHVLLEDADWMTSVNAAIALSRQGSTDGYPRLKEILSGKIVEDPDAPQETAMSEVVILQNTFKAVTGLADSFTAEQRAELIPLISRLADTHREMRIRADAQLPLAALKK